MLFIVAYTLITALAIGSVTLAVTGMNELKENNR